MSSIRPMLATRKIDLTKIIYPCWIQPKIDGIRARAEEGHALSRTNLDIPNKFIQEWFGKYGPVTQGLDGEIVVVDPVTDELLPFNDIQSHVMSEGGAPNFKYVVFDKWNDPTSPYEYRLRDVQRRVETYLDLYAALNCGRLEMITGTYLARDQDELLLKKEELVEAGHEGAIIRFINSPYKYGRSTMRHGGLIKFKDFLDDEARVVGFEELEHNDNPAELDAFGRTKRSSHKANQRAGNMLGKLVVHNPKWPNFKIGSGFDMSLRQEIWDNKDKYLDRIVSFKYQPHGMKDKPRSPIFKGFRHPMDIGDIS